MQGPEVFCERCGARQPVERHETEGSGAVFARRLRSAVTGTTADGVRPPTNSIFLRLCLDCRGYSCPACWNDQAGVCQTCAPLPEPVFVPEPVVIAEPVVVAEPEPVVAEPVVIAEPVVVAEPEPVVAEPVVIAEPEPVVAPPPPEPTFAPAEPVLVTFEAAAEPAAVPEPVVFEPVFIEPVVEAQPEPEPVVAGPEPEPAPVAAEPVVPEPTPAPMPQINPWTVPQPMPVAQPQAQTAQRPQPLPMAQPVPLPTPSDPVVPAPMIVPRPRPAIPYEQPYASAAPMSMAAAPTPIRPVATPAYHLPLPVLAGQEATPAGVRSCINCQLAVSAKAHFCRRCGTSQLAS